MLNTRTLGITFAPLLFLTIPLVMNWPWDLSDFVIMGVLLFMLGSASAVTTTKVRVEYRFVAMLVILGVFFLVWAELAVGIFGTPFAGS